MQVPVCDISTYQQPFSNLLRDKLREDRGGKRFPLSPSQVMACKRKLQFDLVNYYKEGSIPREDFSTSSLLKFEYGHKREKALADLIAQIPEVEVIEDKNRFTIYEEGDLIIKGEFDRLLKDTTTGEVKLWDAKTINDAGFKKVKQTRVPLEYNYYQQQLYLGGDLLRKQYGVTKGILHYENKNTHEWLMLEFPFNQAAYDYGIQQLLAVWNSGSRLLPRDYIFGRDWNCGKKYCPYHAYCYKKLYVPGDSPYAVRDDDTKVGVLLSELERSKGPLRKQTEQYLILHLTNTYGDYSRYRYKDVEIQLEMLKTTIQVKVNREDPR